MGNTSIKPVKEVEFKHYLLPDLWKIVLEYYDDLDVYEFHKILKTPTLGTGFFYDESYLQIEFLRVEKNFLHAHMGKSRITWDYITNECIVGSDCTCMAHTLNEEPFKADAHRKIDFDIYRAIVISNSELRIRTHVIQLYISRGKQLRQWLL